MVRLVKIPIEFLCFSSLWIINNYNNLNYSQCVLLKRWKWLNSWKELSVKLPVASKCNCSRYGLMFITWIQSTTVNCAQKMETCNVFVFAFIKHLFKRRSYLHIGCLVEKLINHIVLIWTVTFRDCICYIFASLFCMSKREYLWNMENVF